jgi:hypothetical protein
LVSSGWSSLSSTLPQNGAKAIALIAQISRFIYQLVNFLLIVLCKRECADVIEKFLPDF